MRLMKAIAMCYPAIERLHTHRDAVAYGKEAMEAWARAEAQGGARSGRGRNGVFAEGKVLGVTRVPRSQFQSALASFARAGLPVKTSLPRLEQPGPESRAP